MLVQRFAPFSPLVYLALATCVEHPSSPRAPRPQAADVAAASAPVLLAAGDIASCSQGGDELTAQILEANPGAVLALGDNAFPDGTLADYQTCYEPSWGRYKDSTYVVLGNHEYDTGAADGSFDYFGDRAGPRGTGYYSFDLGSWHIIVLNSNGRFVDGTFVPFVPFGAGSEQDQWLQADLAANTKPCTLAAFHQPRFFSSNEAGFTSSGLVRIFWQRLSAAGADIVLAAQEHDYERLAPMTPDGVLDEAHGIREFNVGTGGESVGLPIAIAANSEALGAAFGVLKLTLFPDHYTWQFIPAGEDTFTDEGSGTCHNVSSPSPQTISFAALPDRTFGDASFSVSGTASSSLPVSYTVGSGDNCTMAGDMVTITGAGSCSVTAIQPGDGTYAAADPVTQAFAIAKATPVLAWSPPSTTVYGTPLSAAQLTAAATGVGDAALAGTFTYTPGSGTVLGPGTQTVSVSFLPADAANYTGAGTSAPIAVLYNTAVGHTLLAPIDARPDTVKAVRIGSTIPVKFQLFFPDSVTPVSTARATLRAILMAGPSDEPVVPASANQEIGFRFDGRQYVFNVGTDNWTPGRHQIIVTLDDGSTIVGTVDLRTR